MGGVGGPEEAFGSLEEFRVVFVPPEPLSAGETFGDFRRGLERGRRQLKRAGQKGRTSLSGLGA